VFARGRISASRAVGRLVISNTGKSPLKLIFKHSLEKKKIKKIKIAKINKLKKKIG
jgi:hypothetical protein